MAHPTRHRWVVASALVGCLALVGCGPSNGDMALFDITPRTADVSGEQPVDLLGANFRKDIGYAVYFGTEKATSVTILGQDRLRVRTPRVEETGPVVVTVLADNGPGFRVTGGFAFVDESKGAGGTNAERGNLRY